MDDWQARQMAVARQSFIAQHQHAAQSQHHQAQQAQQVAQQQAAQQQVAQQQAAQQQQIAAAIAQRRNSSFFMPPFNQTGHQMAMVTTAKLALPKKNKSSLSNLAVRSTVPRQNVAGGIYSVAQWARKCVEDNIEFLVKLTRRNNPKEQVAMLAYGDGCQTLILLDEAVNKIPGDISKVKKISIGVSAAPIDDKSDEIKMASTFGVLTPTDCLWDHLRYEQSNISKDNPEHIMFLHTTMKVYGEGIDGRRRVLQVKTEASKSPYEATEYISNPEFEQAVLARWTGHLVPQAVLYNPPAIAMNAAAAAAYVAATTPDDDDDDEEEDDQDEFVITFNPKEILLLEKAFDENLTSRDLKSKAYKWEEKDTLKCQETIKRLQNEFTLVDPRKKKNTAKKATTTAKKAKKAVKCSPKKLPMKKDNSTESKKSTPKKQDLHDKKDGKVETSKTKLKSLKKQGDKKKIETGKTELKSSNKQGDKKKIEISKTELKSSKKQGEKKKEEKVKKAKRPSISKGKAITEPLKKKVKSPSASTTKVKKETPKKTKKEPEKSSSPENSDDELVTSLKKPENGKPKVGREEVNTSSKSKSTPTKKTSTDKKRKSITKKQSTSEKKKDSAGKKRGREKDAPKKNSKKARSKSKSSDSK